MGITQDGQLNNTYEPPDREIDDTVNAVNEASPDYLHNINQGDIVGMDEDNEPSQSITEVGSNCLYNLVDQIIKEYLAKNCF